MCAGLQIERSLVYHVSKESGGLECVQYSKLRGPWFTMFQRSLVV